MALENVKRNAHMVGRSSTEADGASSNNFDARSNSAFSKNVQLRVHLDQSSVGGLSTG